jgi:hypothetical protein
MTTAPTQQESRHEVMRLLERIRVLTRELDFKDARGGPDVDLRERELERLRWRLAAVVRESGEAA